MASAARDLRYNRNSYVSDNLARELDRDLDREVREREFRHAGEARREEAAPKVRTRAAERPLVRERQRVSWVSVTGFAAVVVMAVMVLFCYVQLTQISSQVVALKKQLDVLEADNAALTVQYQQMYDLSTVKEVAEAAGMAKPRASQIYYVDLSSGDSAVVCRQEDPGVLSAAAARVSEGFSALLEYFD
ncbi:hypothetical protein [Dysosmobacter sp.]|uniref:hypothetical protein n=1 Tax=Dysosmobacter sp. TaxID=2591382 RepID=UPI002A85B589|nr:hypothetical protein [Dysosmobacter sp.]MDY3281065.1 hypothetical protein [Dysosmobacter sp.]